MLPRPATLIDLAAIAKKQTMRECAEATGISPGNLSNLVLGTRFPQNPYAFISKVTPYLVASLLPELNREQFPLGEGVDLKSVVADQLEDAYAVESYFRALFENSAVAAGLARCAAQILAGFSQEDERDGPFESEHALLLLRDFLHPYLQRLSPTERRRLFARYCDLRVRQREHYYLDLFSQSPRRLEVADQSPLPKLTDLPSGLSLPPEPRLGEPQKTLQALTDAGLTSLAVPALKIAASLDVLMCLTDTIQLEFKFPSIEIVDTITLKDVLYTLVKPVEHKPRVIASCVSGEHRVEFDTYLP